MDRHPRLADAAPDGPQYAMHHDRKEKVRLFGYADLNYRYHGFHYHFNVNILRHNEGRDMAAYERLMSKVRATRAEQKEAGAYAEY